MGDVPNAGGTRWDESGDFRLSVTARAAGIQFGSDHRHARIFVSWPPSYLVSYLAEVAIGADECSAYMIEEGRCGHCLL